MNKLEYYILKILQEMINDESLQLRYIELEGQLIAVKRGVEEAELYLVTECILDGRTSPMIEFSRVFNDVYKVTWTPRFKYLIGSIDSDEVPVLQLTKELTLLRMSGSPISNYLKTI